MLYLRTASGDFINAASIAQLTPQRDRRRQRDHRLDRNSRQWNDDDLGRLYTTPGRIEKAPDYMPAVNAGAVGERSPPLLFGKLPVRIDHGSGEHIYL